MLEESQMTDSAASGSGHIEKHDRPPDPPDLSASSVRPQPASQAFPLPMRRLCTEAAITAATSAAWAVSIAACICGQVACCMGIAPVDQSAMEGVSLQGTAGPEIDGGSQDMRETWMLLEYADRGNLDRAIVQKKMMTHDKLLDMVCL